jgi:hypothetical protein
MLNHVLAVLANGGDSLWSEPPSRHSSMPPHLDATPRYPTVTRTVRRCLKLFWFDCFDSVRMLGHDPLALY